MNSNQNLKAIAADKSTDVLLGALLLLDAKAVADPYLGWTREVVHYLDMPCLLNPGDTTTNKRDDVTCASCLTWAPQVPGRCAHERIALMSRHFDKVTPAYRWNCGACGYQTDRLVDGTPAAWWRNAMENTERKQMCDEEYATWTAKR